MLSDTDIYKDIISNHPGISVKGIRRKYKVGYGRAKRIHMMAGSSSPPDRIEYSANGQSAVLNYRGRIRTLSELLSAANVDADKWMVDRYSVNSWEGPGSGGVQQYFQVKANLVRSPRSVIKEVFGNLDIHKANPSGPTPKGDKLLVISPADFHFGKYAWNEETGSGNYDVDIARSLYVRAISWLFETGSSLGGVEKVLLIIGNDLIHVDSGAESTTTAGTRQDVDGRWQKAFRAALMATIESIDKIAAVVPVDVIIQPGNHDSEKAQVLGIALEMRYSESDRVKIINTNKFRKYYAYGETLLGITHGDRIKLSVLPGIMAKEARELWGRAKYAEWLIGHFHAKREISYLPLTEFEGVRVRVLPSLSAPDAWHAQSGFNMSIRASEALLYLKSGGYMATFSFSV